MVTVSFEEEQSLPAGWILLVLATGVVVAVVALAVEDPAAPSELVPLVGIFALLGVWLSRMALITRVGPSEVTLRFRGLFKTRTIPIAAIEQAYARQYRPLMEYGGWGIRLGLSGWAYNVRGREGVQLKLKGAKPLLIGSQRAQALADAITSSAVYGR